MTATNHALTGAVIGLVVGQPLIAVPAAFISHFVCDALPHYASSLSSRKWIGTKHFRNYLISTAALCIALVAILAIFRPQHWFLASICALVATTPDMFSINQFLKIRQNRPWHPGLYKKFADGIQWFSKPIGAVVEVAWFAAAIILLVPFLR